MAMAAQADLLEDQIRAAAEEWLERWTEAPTRLSWPQRPLQVGEPAPDLELVDSSANSVSLSSFWRESPALIVFSRQCGRA
jgi:hypothetical protein